MADKQSALTAEQILETGRTRRIKEVPYMGATVYAHGMKRAEAKAFWRACREASGDDEAGRDPYEDERLIVHCIRDGAGKRIFTDAHLPQLADMNLADSSPLIEACYEVNGFGVIGRAALAKNSQRTQKSDSGSDSPPTTESA
jgi:hypothetical protein